MAALTFENPANGYRENVPAEAFVYAFLFGPAYLLYKELWAQFLIYMLVVSPAFASLGQAGFLAVLFLNLGYCIAIGPLVSRDFRRRGWKQVVLQAK